ncbi:MAG: CsbD family protein [Chloroflexota bacterium]|nr:MAG: CsbD family protein [Chloroflexota bacterium]
MRPRVFVLQTDWRPTPSPQPPTPGTNTAALPLYSLRAPGRWESRAACPHRYGKISRQGVNNVADKDVLKGKGEELKGKAREAKGKVTGSEEEQLKGKAEQAKGKVREKLSSEEEKSRKRT